MSKKEILQAFLIGADKETEWMIDWFITTYRNCGNMQKFVFADFGLSPDGRKYVENHPMIIGVMEMENKQPKAWFLKPERIMR